MAILPDPTRPSLPSLLAAFAAVYSRSDSMGSTFEARRAGK